MDAIMNFLPEHLRGQNYWLKYSLVRDGADFNTFKQYVRGAQHTILAIETVDGHVFGSYTASPWRTHYGYYGTPKNTFLWKMRHNRNEKCFSLLEQAVLESEIDVYFYSNLNQMIQLCTSNRIAVGGGKLSENEEENIAADSIDYYLEDEEKAIGFGIAIDADLLNGTSSPCATYRNPCLLSHSSKGEVFQILNLEVWTLTPCVTVASAEKLEMTKFFVE
jgi:hypothetical protein